MSNSTAGSRPRRLRRSAIIAMVTAALAVPAGASAAVTVTHITVPTANPTFITYNTATGASLAVAGISNGGAAAIDLRCDGSTSVLVASNIVPDAAGRFATTLGPSRLAPIVSRTCYLHAVPHTSTSKNHTAFAGIRLGVDRLSETTVAGPANKGALVNFSFTGTQLLGRGQLTSIGSCGLSSSAVYQPDSFATSNSIFTCDARLAPAIIGRSGALVDRQNAVLPSAAATLFGPAPGSAALAGLSPILFSVAVDPTNGNVTVGDTENLVRCSPQTVLPASAATCSSLAPAGVSVARTTVQQADGRQTVVSDTWSSTDGKSHEIDLLYESTIAGTTPAVSFPWLNKAYVSYSPNFVVPPAPTLPATFYVKTSATAPENTAANAIGAVSFRDQPTQIRFKSTNTVWLQYVRTVRPGDATTISVAYSRATNPNDVLGLASAAQTGLGKALCIVPKIRGLKVTDARTRLHAANCSLGKITFQYSDRVGKGKIVWQHELRGTTLFHGATVGVSVSKGKRPH